MWVGLKAVSFGYSIGEPILTAVDLEIATGEAVALVAPSGSGKTTLLSILGGLLRPDSGSVVFGGGGGSFARPGWIFQTVNLIGRRTVLDNTALPLVLAGSRRSAANESSLAALSQLGISHLAQRRCESLSGGEMQRVGIARCLAMSPPFVLADEPTANLDATNAAIVGEALFKLSESMPLLVATHDADLARRADRTVELRDAALHEVK